MQEVITRNQNDFFIAFKNKMQHIMKEMLALKEKASEKRLELKKDDQLTKLTLQRDFFRGEALKLSAVCKNQKVILDRLKVKYEGAQEDKEYYQACLLDEKLNAKALSLENDRFK